MAEMLVMGFVQIVLFPTQRSVRYHGSAFLFDVQCDVTYIRNLT